MKRFLVWMLVVGIAVSGAPLVAASAANGKLEGIAVYENGDPVPNATVQLRSVDTGSVVQRATANQQGFFIFTDVPEGRYVIEIVAGDNVKGLTEALVVKPEGLAGLKVVWKESDKAGWWLFRTNGGRLLLGAAVVGAGVGAYYAFKDDASPSK